LPSRALQFLCPGLKRTALPWEGDAGLLAGARFSAEFRVLRVLTLKDAKPAQVDGAGPRPEAILSDSKTVSTACSLWCGLTFVLVPPNGPLTRSNLITQASRSIRCDLEGLRCSLFKDMTPTTTLSRLFDQVHSPAWFAARERRHLGEEYWMSCQAPDRWNPQNVVLEHKKWYRSVHLTGRIARRVIITECLSYGYGHARGG